MTGLAAGTRELKEVSESFAALLWQEVLKPFQRSLLPGLTGSPAGSLYAGLALEVLARQLARQPGLAEFLRDALAGASVAGPPAGRKFASPEYNRADRA